MLRHAATPGAGDVPGVNFALPSSGSISLSAPVACVGMKLPILGNDFGRYAPCQQSG